MLEKTKSKFTKAKHQPSLAYHEQEAKRKKNAPNPHIAKLDQTEKEGIKIALQTEWDQKIQNMTLQSKVNHNLINYTIYTHFDQKDFIAYEKLLPTYLHSSHLRVIFSRVII